MRDLNSDGYVDNPMGTVLSGTWSAAGELCRFTLFASASVFARQIFYVRLSVNNPRQALARTDPLNKWYVRIQASNETLGGSVGFISLEEEGKGSLKGSRNGYKYINSCVFIHTH